MDPEGSLLHSQEPATCLYPEPDRSIRTEEPVWFRGFSECFVTWLIFYGEELLALPPAAKLQDHALSAVCDCFFSIFAATLHICWPFLHPQPEDAPCRADRHPQ
jgi:hypothetical protein